MRGIRRLTALLAVAALAVAITAPAGADDGSGKALLKSGLRASLLADDPIMGIAPGGRDWVIDTEHSRAVVRQDGRLRVRIEGLLFKVPGPPLPPVSASVACGDMLVSSDVQVQLSETGDAEIEDQLTLPQRCDDPMVFVHPRLTRTTFIAVTTGDDE